MSSNPLWPPSPPAADIIASRGACLKKRPPTPTALAFFDPHFYERLCHDLRLLQICQEVRDELYGPLACESRLAHTPPDVRNQFQNDEHEDMRTFIALMTPPTPGTPERTPAFLSPSSTVPNRDGSSTSPVTPPASYQDAPAVANPSPKCKRTSTEAGNENAMSPLKRTKPLGPHHLPRPSSRLLKKHEQG